MTNIAPKKSKVKRQKRPRRLNKKIPAPMSHMGNSLANWGQDVREWLNDPAIPFRRGHPDPTSPIPTFGWFRFEGGDDHQIIQPYGTQLPEPDETPSPSTSLLNTPSSQICIDVVDDIYRPPTSDKPYHVDDGHDTVTNEQNGDMSMTSNTLFTGTLILSSMPHGTTRTNGSGLRCSTPTVASDIFTLSDSASYTTSSSSASSSNWLDDIMSDHGHSPLDMGSNNTVGQISNITTPYMSPSPSTYQSLQQEYLLPGGAQGNLYSYTNIDSSTTYNFQSSYHIHDPSVSSINQSWSQSAHLSDDINHFHTSSPSPHITYPNMSDHSLAPMIPHVSGMHNRSASLNHIRTDEYFHGGDVTDLSRAIQASQSSSGQRVASHLSGRRTTPPSVNYEPISHDSSAIRSQIRSYSWNSPYVGNVLISPGDSNYLYPAASLGANPAPIRQGTARGTRGNNRFDGAPQWDLGNRAPGFPQ